jgi:Lanthionine synthetase C-like protein
LIQGGTFTWAAGPLAKGSNLCHGTGGNGYAFLKLYRRTRDLIWLERARAFAMTAIAQCREAHRQLGRGRYSLWTGDVGLAIYLWDCITAEPRFPTIDVF